MESTSYSTLVAALNDLGDIDLAESLNDPVIVTICEEDMVTVESSRTATKYFLDYLSISADNINFGFISKVLNTKVFFAPNRGISLRLKGSEVRPHFYLPIGKYGTDNIFVTFVDRGLAPSYRQPSLLDPTEANAFYFAVAKVLAQFNKSVFIAQDAQSILDTNFKDPFKCVSLDTV